MKLNYWSYRPELSRNFEMRWSPRGRGRGLEDPRGQLMVSLALALKLKSLALASDAKSLTLASQSNLTLLGFGLESKILNHHVVLWGQKVPSQVPIPITVKNYLGFVRQQSTGLSQFTILHSLFEKIFCAPATSAPVELVFSHSRLFMRPHRARMGDKMLSDLGFLQCNKHIWFSST